jgi:hypothetical protein
MKYLKTKIDVIRNKLILRKTKYSIIEIFKLSFSYEKRSSGP